MLQVGFGNEFVYLRSGGGGDTDCLLKCACRAGLQHEEVQGELQQAGAVQLQVLAELFQVVQHAAGIAGLILSRGLNT